MAREVARKETESPEPHMSRITYSTNKAVGAQSSRTSAAARLAEIVGSNPTGGMDVCERCVLSGRGLCDELITRREKSYRLWCVVVCDLKTSYMKRAWPTVGLSCQKQTYKAVFEQSPRRI